MGVDFLLWAKVFSSMMLIHAYVSMIILALTLLTLTFTEGIFGN